MLDSVLDWLAVVLPTVLSIVGVFVSIKAPGSHHHRGWRIGLVVAGLSLSVITFWQQHRSKAAHSSEIAQQKADMQNMKSSLEGQIKETGSRLDYTRGQLDSMGVMLGNIAKNTADPKTGEMASFLATIAKSAAAKSDKNEQSLAGSLFLDCQASMMPSTNPSSGHVYAIELFGVNVKSGAGGIADHFTEPGGKWIWNNDELPNPAHRCELSNYYKRTVLNLHADFVVQFSDIVRNWPVIIPKVDPGPANAFVFYIRNCCEQTLFLVAGPSKAMALFEGENTPTEIKIVRSDATAPAWLGGMMSIDLPLKKKP